MSRTTARRLPVALGTVVAVTAATLAVTATPAFAYDFPFPSCGNRTYFHGPSQTTAIYDHRDGNQLWYKIWWGRTQPVPSDPYHPANWAHCWV